MKTGRFLAAGALMFVFGAGLVQAKIPVPPMDDATKAQAAEKTAKAAEAAKQAAEQLAKAQDRVAERYKKSHGNSGKPEAAAKGARPAAKK